MEWHKGCHGWVMTPIFGEKKIHWATYPQAITDSSCLSSPTSTWIINKCLEKKHLFLQIIYRESIHYLQLGYYPKLWAPGLFNSLACSMAWRNFKGDPWSLEIVPPACAAKVLKKVVSWHQSLGDGVLDCYDQRDRYFAHTENQFSSLLWLSKNWRLWFKTLPKAFGTSGKRMRIKQIWALHFANAQDKFVTLPHRRSGSTLATCMKRWLVRSPCLLSSELCLDLNGLLANGPWQLDHGETPTWNPHISQVVVKLTDPEPATLWVAGANIPNLQRTRECWTRPGPGQRPSCLMTDLSSSPCLRIKGGDTLHRMKSESKSFHPQQCYMTIHCRF